MIVTTTGIMNIVSKYAEVRVNTVGIKEQNQTENVMMDVAINTNAHNAKRHFLLNLKTHSALLMQREI